MNAQGHLVSIPSSSPSHIQFVNNSKYVVSLEWIDFHGKHQNYCPQLQPLQAVNAKTFVGHPFVAYERKHRHQMSFWNGVSRNLICFPTSSRRESENGVIYISSRMVITIPMRSLKDTCLQFVHKLVAEQSNIDLLPIPDLIKISLQQKFMEQFDFNIPIVPNPCT